MPKIFKTDEAKKHCIIYELNYRNAPFAYYIPKQPPHDELYGWENGLSVREFSYVASNNCPMGIRPGLFLHIREVLRAQNYCLQPRKTTMECEYPFPNHNHNHNLNPIPNRNHNPNLNVPSPNHNPNLNPNPDPNP